MPETYNLIILVVLILVANLATGNIYTKIKGITRIGPHNKDILSIIFGSLLGDSHAEKRSKDIGTRISFYQEETHLSYIYYLHNILASAGYCNSKTPVYKKRLSKNGKIRKVVRFHTWTYTSFNSIHNMWYTNGKKCIPYNIDKYLTPLALSIWIMDDGAKVGKGIKLCTNSFTYKECLLLTTVLHNNFSLKASVQLAGAKNQYVIYIWKQSIRDLRKIVDPYIIPEMKYKII